MPDQLDVKGRWRGARLTRTASSRTGQTQRQHVVSRSLWATYTQNASGVWVINSNQHEIFSAVSNSSNGQSFFLDIFDPSNQLDNAIDIIDGRHIGSHPSYDKILREQLDAIWQNYENIGPLGPDELRAIATDVDELAEKARFLSVPGLLDDPSKRLYFNLNDPCPGIIDLWTCPGLIPGLIDDYLLSRRQDYGT